MRPVLFELGPVTVHSYGVMIALAAVLAWWVLRHELQRRENRGDEASILVMSAMLGGFLGARGYYAVEHLTHEGAAALMGASGFTWYGGAIGGALAVLVVARIRRIPIDSLVASAAPALALGYAIGRVGCQLAGDGTYGVPSDLPWAMSYPDGEDPTTVRVHPAPVYETLTGLAMFGVLWRLRDKLRPVSLFGLYLVLAGISRFLVEFIRLNDPVVAGLTQPQLFAASFVVLGLALLTLRPRHGPAAAAA